MESLEFLIENLSNKEVCKFTRRWKESSIFQNSDAKEKITDMVLKEFWTTKKLTAEKLMEDVTAGSLGRK